MARIFLIGLLFVATSISSVIAVEVEGLYQVEVPVADQSNKNQWGAMLEGFKVVLIRKSGSRQILTTEESRQAYRKVKAYVQRFQYLPNPEPETEFPYVLKLDFEPRLVEELIQEAGMPIWGSNRPVTIMWLAAEENFNRQILKDDAENPISGLLKVDAKRRGIPIIFPLMDLEDELNVTISDVWGRFNNTVVNASSRYGADSVVAGRLAKIGEVWQAKLSYINQGEEQFLEFDVESPELLTETLTDRVAELLCQRYCVVEALASRQIAIQVSGVNNFASFKSVQDYLQGLSSIRKIEVNKISANIIRFSATLLGDVQSVKDGIKLGRKMIVEVAPEIDPFAKPINPPVATDGDQMIEGSSGFDIPVSELTSPNLAQTGEGEVVAPVSQNENTEALTEMEGIQDVVLYYRWTE
ncbi:DUF2066 domain-containing protein [Aliikangiella marina]|uniref:DUF2066 domain-containing protein n=1 Tax=Aliikangiella marina TaxID=1712262 RepID=UPI00163D550A|nr:DUF2066 domain-containing protein [Aliikangiella marina]